MVVEHPVVVRGRNLGARATAPGSRPPGSPTIVARTDQDFIAAMLDELSGDRAAQAVSDHLVKAHWQSPLKLLQPVHQTFHVALLEVACDITGQPRLDPEKIDSAGLVVRRVVTSSATSLDASHIVADGSAAWMQVGRSFRGWVRLGTTLELDQDPDPARRPPRLRSGHPEIDRLLTLAHGAPEPLAESVAPLFVAPPEVAAATKRTILYGLVPVTSAEVSEAPATPAVYPMEVIKAHVPQYLQASSAATAVVLASAVVDASWADRPELASYVTMLRQLAIECDAFGDSVAGQTVFAALNGIQLPYDDGTTRPAGDELKRATDVLVGRGAGQVTLPKEWPPVSTRLADRIAGAIKAAMESRLSAIAPRRGRFDDLGALYCVRAFVRVKRKDGCPPALAWSPPSEPFAIAPWYDTGAPVEIVLPGIDSLRKLKPNVSFRMPESLFNTLQSNTLKDLLGGNTKSNGSHLGLGWICSFSIPIITLCAFITLNLFLSLFDLIFQWMLSIKICLPIPVPTKDEP
jgi:hypothetical protein